MLIPLGTDRPLRRPTITTYLLIGLSIAAYLVQLKTQVPLGQFTRPGQFALWGMLWHPESSGYGGAGFHWWQFITYQFLHSEHGWWHIGGNMLALYVFGPNIEDRLGRIWFLLFYLLGGVAAGALQLAFSRNPLIGASGAIAACTGAYLVMFPRTQIKVFFLLGFGFTQISAWWFITFSICMDLGSTLFGRVRMPFSSGDNVAHLAHLGGYFYGAAIALMLLWLKIVPREQYDLFTVGRQAYRRRQFKAAENAAQQRVQQRNRPKNPYAEQEAEALAIARADVIAKVNAHDLPAAGAAYKKLADTFANYIGGTTLSRRYQYDIANYFYSIKDNTAAIYAYERFLEAYPKDPEAPSIMLLTGLIHARAFNDPIKAKQLITASLKDLDDSSAAIARKELEALG